MADGKNEQCCVDHFTERNQTAKSLDPWILNSLARQPSAPPDPVTISFIAAIALIDQAWNSDPSYRQGLQGYAKRFGTFFADTGIGTLMTTSVFPALVHRDPRHFQLGKGGAWHRVIYSVSQILVTPSDSGEGQFNYSEVVGNAVAAGISNVYHPPDQRTLGHTVTVWGTDVMLNALCNVAKEFWPDIRRKIHKKKKSD